MYKQITIIVFAIGLYGCDQDRILTSDIDILIENQVKSNEDILNQMNSFIDKHGKEGFERSHEIVKDFVKIHEEVKKFNVSVDKIDKSKLPQASNEFVHQTFEGLTLEHPLTITLDENTPRSLIKLQILNLENLYLRERGGQVSFSFNNFELVVIPDKVNYKKDEMITGKIFLAGYSDELRRPMRLNGREIDVKAGKGLFSIEPKDLNGESKQLKAEMSFPDTTFTTYLRFE